MSINIIQPVIKSSEIHSPFLIFIRKYFYLGSQKKKKKKGNKLVTFFLGETRPLAWEYIKKQKSGTDPHRAQRRPGPKNFFFEQVKFSENKKKGLGPPLVFSSGPLPKYHEPLEPIIRLTQEPMTQVNLLKKKKTLSSQ